MAGSVKSERCRVPAALPSRYSLKSLPSQVAAARCQCSTFQVALLSSVWRPLGPAEAERDLPPRQEVHVKKALVDRLRVVGRLRHQRHLPRRQGQGLEADLDGKLLEPGRNGQRRRPDFAAVAETEHVVVSRRGRGRQGQDKTHGREKVAGLHTPHLTPAAGRCHAGGTCYSVTLDESRPLFRGWHTTTLPLAEPAIPIYHKMVDRVAKRRGRRPTTRNILQGRRR